MLSPRAAGSRVWARCIAIGLVAAALNSPVALGAEVMKISSAGTIAGLRLNVATDEDVLDALGQPAIQAPVTTGGCSGSPSVCGGPPAFQELGYGCPSSGVPEDDLLANCQTQFYLSSHSGHLVAFATDSTAYTLDGRIRVGTKLTKASKVLGAPVGDACDEAAGQVTRRGKVATLIASGIRGGNVARLDVVATTLKAPPFGVGLAC